MAFEYKIASAEEPMDAHVVQSLLDAYGKDNWDLAFVTQSATQIRLFFRKQVADAPEPAAAIPRPAVVARPTVAQEVRPLTQRLVGVAELDKLRGK